jgi:anti-sigma factor RsiW
MSSIPPPPPITDDDLHALVDGRLAPHAHAALLARVEADPIAAQTLAAWRRQREALGSLHLALMDEPMPAALAQAARQAHSRQLAAARWWRWGGMAASVLLAFGLGWTLRSVQGPGGTGPDTAVRLLAGSGTAAPVRAHEFARQAAVAHAVYSPEVRHPVEVAAAQQEHLVQWLSKRLGRPLKVPNLGGQGYELVGGRLLPGDQGARAQFMFQNAAGLRVTLYVGAVDPKSSAAGSGSQPVPAAGSGSQPVPAATSRETAFSFSSDGPVPSFYWVEQGFGYALAGPLSRADLLELADLVYRQL